MQSLLLYIALQSQQLADGRLRHLLCLLPSPLLGVRGFALSTRLATECGRAPEDSGHRVVIGPRDRIEFVIVATCATQR